MSDETGFSRCRRTLYTSPVDGSDCYMWCNIERVGQYGCCGRDGAFFEPKVDPAQLTFVQVADNREITP
jgi:hypothetical protein